MYKHFQTRYFRIKEIQIIEQISNCNSKDEIFRIIGKEEIRGYVSKQKEKEIYYTKLIQITSARI